MNHRAGLSRQQTLLFPETLEDYVTAENPVRFLDAFVARLDLHTLGFARAIPEPTGRPPYNPADLLKLFLYGYRHRSRSSRALERECQRNVELIWLLGKLAPDFKTIADFRKDNLKPLQAVARQFTVLCRKLELFGGELLAIDGSKFAGVNSREANYNEKKLRERLAQIDAQIQAYLKALEEADVQEAQSPEPLSRDELTERIAQLRERKEWYEGLEVELEASEEKQISLTDPEARRMHTTPGSVVGYNAQVAVDAKNKLIAAEDVTNEVTDVRQLASVAE